MGCDGHAPLVRTDAPLGSRVMALIHGEKRRKRTEIYTRSTALHGVHSLE